MMIKITYAWLSDLVHSNRFYADSISHTSDSALTGLVALSSYSLLTNFIVIRSLPLLNACICFYTLVILEHISCASYIQNQCGQNIFYRLCVLLEKCELLWCSWAVLCKFVVGYAITTSVEHVVDIWKGYLNITIIVLWLCKVSRPSGIEWRIWKSMEVAELLSCLGVNLVQFVSRWAVML